MLRNARVLSLVAAAAFVGHAALSCSAGGSAKPQNTGTGAASGAAGSAGSGAGGLIGMGGSAAAGASGAGGSVIQTDGGGVGGGPPIDGGCQGINEQATNTVRPVDIIWAVDTSDSMVAELQAVEANLNNFSSFILNQGIDVHVVLIARAGKPTDGSLFNPNPGICIGPPLATGVCPGGSNPPRYQHVEQGVGSNSALAQIIAQYPNYKPTLRQNSLKYFAVVTDDDSDMTSPAFTTAVNGLDPGWFDNWKFFGIFCLGGCSQFLACAATGSTYNQLVQQTGGLAGDLCGGNATGFQPVFDALAKTVVDAKTLACDWDIPPPPAGEMFEKNKVNVRYTPGGGGAPEQVFHANTPADCDPALGGWYYNDNANPTKIHVCPATCQKIQTDFNAKLDIEFGCFTVPIPK